MAEDASAPNALKKLLALADQLKAAGIHHDVTRYRDDGVSIIAAVPGERWEIDVLDDGEVVVEVHKSQGGCRGEEAINELLGRHLDEQQN
ncbi:MAG: hypothetical protein ABL907_15665 [Hyphomicrobium sp.]